MSREQQSILRGMGTGAERAARALSLLLGGMAMVLLAAMVVLITVDVVGRYLFNSPLTGSADITQQLLLGTLFLGLGYATLHRSHIRMTFFVERLTPTRQRTLNLATDVVGLLIVAVFARESYTLALRSLQRGENIPYAPFFFPAFWPQLAVALGLTVFGLQLAVDTFKRYRGE